MHDMPYTTANQPQHEQEHTHRTAITSLKHKLEYSARLSLLPIFSFFLVAEHVKRFDEKDTVLIVIHQSV